MWSHLFLCELVSSVLFPCGAMEVGGGGHEFVFFEEVGAPKKEERYKIECPEKSV